VFATHVGLLADQMDHHPDITIGYQKVKVSINTHDVDGISELDFVLARKLG
jgi:4a-hydroxytetrahydrobiopterin dehydratase